MAKQNHYTPWDEEPEEQSEEGTAETSEVKDSKGNVLKAGDTVTIIKGLKVKGGKDIKQGTTVKNIRLTDDNEAIEGKVDGSVIVIKTIYVRKG